MAHKSTYKFAKCSARKARLIADMIRDKSVDEALTALQFNKKRAAVMVGKALNAAIANADYDENANVDVRRLYVSEARVDEGPTAKRFQPKDRGRAHPILKRTCHIVVSVDQR